MAFDNFLSTLSAKDKLNVERHLTACEADGGLPHATLWKRLISKLATLAPMPAQTIGQHAVMFFIADGKYKMQVFAIEDQRQGEVVVYLPDVLDQAIKVKVIRKGKEHDDGMRYPLGADDRQSLRIESLNARMSGETGAHYKNMLGWNRLALRAILPVDATSQEIAAVENLCMTAAQKWAVPA
jgi:hypothetical protein